MGAFGEAQDAYNVALVESGAEEPEKPVEPARKLGKREQAVADILGEKWGGSVPAQGGWRNRIQRSLVALAPMLSKKTAGYMEGAVTRHGWANRFMAALLVIARGLDEK